MVVVFQNKRTFVLPGVWHIQQNLKLERLELNLYSSDYTNTLILSICLNLGFRQKEPREGLEV